MGQITDEWGLESVDPSQTSSGNSSFKRVVHKVNTNARCRFCLWLVALFCAANVMFMLIGYDAVVEKVAVGHMVLQNGSGPKYEAWTQAPMPVYYKVTVFNLTNPYSFMKGARPRLKECGPYTYRMLEKKVNIKFHDNGTVTYKTQPLYIFDYGLSGGGEDDVIWTVNIPLINAADAVKNNEFLKTVIQVAQKVHGFKTLRELSVKELLWGYKSHVMDWARTLQDVPYPHPQFGLLVGFNNTPQEPYTMYTGASDPKYMNAIYAWNGMTKLNFWSGETCNEIKGTDASGFHPNISPNETLFIFNGQLCRSLPLIYEQTIMHSGVETYRFVPPSDIFSYGPKHPQNSCFCSRDGCPPRGLLDMKPCYYGAAVAFSFPHFYQADPILRHVVRGLSPDRELHGTHFDIYPALGVPVRVKLRMQMNVVIDGTQELQRDRHFDVVFPVFWFEAGIDSLPVEMVGMLKMAQDLPSVVKATSVTVCTVLSVVFLFLLLASTFSAWCGIAPDSSRTETPDHLPDTHWPATHPQSIMNSSGYAAGSLASLGPDDSYRAGIVPYPIYPTGDVLDSYYKIKSDIRNEDDPPAYSSMPDTTKLSTSSILSVEIHKSASMHSLNIPPTRPETIEDEFTVDRVTPEVGERCFSEENPRRVTPSTPTSPVLGQVVAPLASDERIAIESADDLLATSSPQDSPNTTTTSCTDATSCRALSERAASSNASSSTESSPTHRPAPLESDL